MRWRSSGAAAALVAVVMTASPSHSTPAAKSDDVALFVAEPAPLKIALVVVARGFARV